MFRKALFVVSVLVAMMALAAPAAADPPIQETISGPASILLEAPEFCPSSDIQVDVEQQFKLITFTRDTAFGLTSITVGKIFATVTNLETGESVHLAIPGPGFLDATGLPVVGTGPWLIFNPGSVEFIRGFIEFVPSPTGVEANVVRGTTIDVCALVGAD